MVHLVEREILLRAVRAKIVLYVVRLMVLFFHFDSKLDSWNRSWYMVPVAVPLPVYVTILEVESLKARILIVLSSYRLSWEQKTYRAENFFERREGVAIIQLSRIMAALEF
jgi:hypothetical protein